MFGETTMLHSGRCYCGAIRYQATGTPKSVSLCHCTDCRLSAGAPMTAWAEFGEGQLTITQGNPKTINLSRGAIRSFCADCGTGLFYRNAELLPGVVEIQSATLLDPNALPPTMHIQIAERLDWMPQAHLLPTFERFAE
jgi:hypothetical protein